MAVKHLVLEKRFLRLVQRMVRDEVIVGGEEESAGAARGIGNGFVRLGAHALDHAANQGAGREILAGARKKR
jgi:hypothetical protein